MVNKSKRAGNCSHYIRTEHLIRVELHEGSSRAQEMVGRNFFVVELGKHQVVSSVMDLISFWMVVAQVDATQMKASLKSDSPPKRLPFEESSSTHRSARMAAADGKMKKYAVEMNLEGLLGKFPDTISRPGLQDFSVLQRISAEEWLKIAVTI